jgi:uncharacterized membrane protein
VAVAGDIAVWLTGCVVMTGLVWTVSVAVSLVAALPIPFFTMTRYIRPLWVREVAGVVYEGEVPPVPVVTFVQLPPAFEETSH